MTLLGIYAIVATLGFIAFVLIACENGREAKVAWKDSEHWFARNMERGGELHQMSKRVAELNRQLLAVTAAGQKAENDQRSVKGMLDVCRRDLLAARQEIDDLNRRLASEIALTATAEEKLAAARQEIADLRANLTDANAKLEHLRTSLVGLVSKYDCDQEESPELFCCS